MRSGHLTVPEWKQFIHLGEQLLKLPDVAERCVFIENAVQERLSCAAKLWLVEPLYPLPGENEIDTIPSTPVEKIVEETLQTRKIHFQQELDPTACISTQPQEPKVIALPVMSQDLIMGVLVARREKPFTETDRVFLDSFLNMVALALEVSRQVSLKNWRARQLSLVQSVSEQIANMTELDDLCLKVTDLIHELFEFYYVAIYIQDETNGQFRLRAMQHLADCEDFAPAQMIESGKGIIGYVGETGNELLAPDVRNEPHYRYIDCLPETKAELALPLKTEERIFGVLDLQSDRINGFHQNDLTVLRALANNIALAIESADLYQDLQQRVNQVETIVQFSQALTSILDLDDLSEKVAQLIHDRFGYPYIHIFTVQPVRRKLIYGTGFGSRSQMMREKEVVYDLDDPHGIIPWVARHGKTYLANDISQEALFRKLEFLPTLTRSELALPIIYAGEVLGVLDIQSEQKNSFYQDDISLLEALASSIAIAMRNAILYRSEKWRVQVADSFREVSELISANAPLNDVLESILQKLEQNLPCDSSAIWLRFNNDASENKDSLLTLAAAHGVDPEEINNSLENPDVHSMLERTLAQTHPIIRHPDDPYGPLGAALKFPKDYSSIAASLRAGDVTLGILALAHHTAGRYGNEAHDMTATFASYAAVAIQNARLFEEAQEQAWVSTVLLQVAEASQSASNVDELLTTMVRLPPLLIGVRLSAIFLWEDESDSFCLKNWYGIAEQPSQTHFFDYDTPALAKLNATRSTIFIEDAVTDLNLPAEAIPENISNLVMVPLVLRGNLLGAFLLGYQQRSGSDSDGELNKQILAILQGISHQTAVALENLRLEETQEEEAYITAVLLEVAQAVVSQNELDDILETIVHLMPILVGIDTCVIYLRNEKEDFYQPVQAYAGNDEDEIVLLENVYRSGEFPLLDATYAENRLHFSTSTKTNMPVDQWAQLNPHSENDLSQNLIQLGGSILMAVPLSAKGETFGIMLAKETMTSLAFQEKRIEIITGIAQQIALAIQNEKYKLDFVESQRIEQELELARQSQKTFLPGELPRLQRWELDARWKPARQVGGDFYDIIQLDKDHIGLVIADVADKGIAAALYMTVTRTLIRAYSQNETSPAAVLEKVNNLLMPDSHEGMFVTVFYAILSKRSNKIIYANAGHNLPIIARKKSGEIELLRKGGISLGVLDDSTFQDYETNINPGDILLLYTDGVTEAFAKNGETYNQERLFEFIKRNTHLSARDLLDEMEKELKEFSADMPPSDDVTLVCLKRQS